MLENKYKVFTDFGHTQILENKCKYLPNFTQMLENKYKVFTDFGPS